MTLFFSLLLGFLAIRGFRFEITETGFLLRNTESFLWLLLLVFFVTALHNSMRESDRRLKVYAALFSFLVSVFYCFGLSLEKRGSFTWIWDDRSNLINYLNLFFSHFILYYCCTYHAYRFLKKASLNPSGPVIKTFSFRKVLVFWGLLLIVYIPWYLYAYPGVMTYDSGDQVRDALTTQTLSDFNPAFVTLLIRAVLLPVRHFTGSVQIGIGVITALQMMTVTFIFALTLERIFRFMRHPVLFGLAFLWYAFYPVHNIYSVTMWKDIPFTACFLAFLILLDDVAEDEIAFFCSGGKRFLLFLTLLLMPLLRHNGIFITLVMSIFLVFRFRNFRRQVIVICAGALIVFGAWKYLLLPEIRTSKAPSSEMLSVPLQQIARVLVNHHSEINEEHLAEIERYFKIPEIWTKYDPRLADPVKRYFNNNLYLQSPGDFFSLWQKYGKIYPEEYLEAFLNNNYGYWYPETKYWISSFGVIITGTIEDVETAPLAKPFLTDQLYNWYAYHTWLKTPLLPLLFSRGACFWIWLFCGIYCLYANRRKYVVFLPGFLLWFIILGSAVYNEYRYVYGLFAALPLILTACLVKRGQK